MPIKQISAAAERNKGPILEVLKRYLSADGAHHILEIASGSGQHIAHLASHFKNAKLLPTEIDEKAASSIRAYIEEDSLTNVEQPVFLNIRDTEDMWEEDARKAVEALRPYDALININMIHISEFECTHALFRHAAKLLKRGGYVFTYGPYNVDGQFTSESNREFDKSLKERHAKWGVRDVSDVASAAESNGFKLVERVGMPANNFTLVFQQQ